MKKVEFLEGLRGISAAIVMLHHYSYAFLPALYEGDPDITHWNGELFIHNSPLILFINGSSAVAMFLVLSAYIIAMKAKNRQNGENVFIYAIKRYLRLAIPITVWMIVTYGVISSGILQNKDIFDLTKSAWISRQWSVVPNIFVALQEGVYGVLLFKNATYNSALWTLKFIFLGSIATYFVSNLINKYSNVVKICILTTIIIFMCFLQTQYTAFAVGVLAFEIDSLFSEKTRQRKLFKLCMVFGCVISLYALSVPLVSGVKGSTIFAQVLWFKSVENIRLLHISASGLLIYAISNIDSLKNILSHKWAQSLGTISFSLYIIHMLILGTLVIWIFKITNSFFSYYPSVISALIIGIPITLLCAYLYNRTVEKFSIQLIKNLFNKS